MEQAQFKIKLSVGTKLLISMVLLLITVIVVLNFSAIFVLTGDKRETVYQQQATDAYVIGKEFVSTAQRDLDALRLVLANLDPTKPQLWENRKPTIQNVIDNQSDFFLIRIRKVNIAQQTFDLVYDVYRNDILQSMELKPEEVNINPEMRKQLLPSLQKMGFSMVNATGLGQPALLAFMVGDFKVPVSDGVYLVATGFIPLKQLATSNKNTELTITDKSGWVLYDSDLSIQQQRLNIANDPQFSKATETPVSSGTLEFKNDEGRFLGSYYKPGFDLLILAKTPWNLAMRAVFGMIELFILIGVIAIGLAIVFALIYSRGMTAPLNLLYDATKEVAQGNFAVNLDVKSKDEIGALSYSFNLMSRQISELIEEKIKKAHLENEIAIASTVQQTLIPSAEIDTPHFMIRSMYRAADVCGGDWWGYFTVGNHACFAIADATGHGLPSALITAAMRSCYSVIEKRFQDHPDDPYSPAVILSYANRSIYESAKGQIMMTLFLAVLDLKTGKMTYASAGHNPPWLFQKDKNGKTVRKSLVAKGIRLGEGYTVPEFEEKSVQVEPGDSIFLYTDGLIEGKDTQGEMYTKMKAAKKVDQVIDSGPKFVIDELSKEVETHNAGKSLDDDVTLTAIKILKLEA